MYSPRRVSNHGGHCARCALSVRARGRIGAYPQLPIRSSSQTNCTYARSSDKLTNTCTRRACVSLQPWGLARHQGRDADSLGWHAACTAGYSILLDHTTTLSPAEHYCIQDQAYQHWASNSKTTRPHPSSVSVNTSLLLVTVAMFLVAELELWKLSSGRTNSTASREA